MPRPSDYILLDRDGVINEPLFGDYVRHPGMLQVIPSSAEAIARLNRAGYKAIVISNQQGVGKGVMSRADLNAITRKTREVVAEAGGAIVDFFYCTHLASDGCSCRKPRPGLIKAAQAQYGFDPTQTPFVGDSYGDIEAAHRAGCPAIFVLSGNDAKRYQQGDPLPAEPLFIATDLASAVDRLLHDAA